MGMRTTPLRSGVEPENSACLLQQRIGHRGDERRPRRDRVCERAYASALGEPDVAAVQT